MKKIITILVLIFAVQVIALSQDSFFQDKNIFRSNPDWSGSIYLGNTLIVYGEGGVLLKSTDLGETWTQSCINDSMYITKMIARGNELYGISRNQHIFKSTDYGTNWIVKDYGVQKQFNGLVQTNNKLYCLSENKIYEVSPDLELTERYQINTDTAYYELEASGDNLYFTAGKGKLGIINTKNNNQEIIDLEELGFCSGCKTLNKLIKSDDALYFFIKLNLFKYNFSDKKIMQIAKPLKIQDAAIGSYGNSLYNIYSIYDNYLYNIDSIYFYKYNSSNDKWERVDNGKYDRYIINLSFTHLYFINQDKIIAVGKDKLIYISNDGGKTWLLKNCLTKIPNSMDICSSFDSNNAISATGHRFSKTTDGGIIWLPQKNHYKYYSVKYSVINSTPYIIDKNTVFTLGRSGFEQDTNAEVSRDGLNSFTFQNCYTYQISNYRLTYYNFLSKIYTFINATESIGLHLTEHRFYAASVELNDTLGLNWYGGHIKADFIDAIQYNDTIYFLIKDYSDSTRPKFAILSNADSIDRIHPYYLKDEIMLDDYVDSSGYFQQSKLVLLKNILICSFKSTKTGEAISLAINLDNKQITKIKPFNNINYIVDGFELNNIYYVRCQHIIPIPGVDFYAYPALYKINDIDNHPENWELDSSRFIIYSFLFHSDSLDIVTAYDNYLNPNKEYPYIFYLTKKKDSRVNEIEQKSFIYISDPMPNPAENNTQFKVYYPVNLDVNTMQIQVCNILGQVVTNSNAFSVTQINDHIVQINWSIGSFSRGVYLINIKIGNQIGTKAIVIN